MVYRGLKVPKSVWSSGIWLGSISIRLAEIQNWGSDRAVQLRPLLNIDPSPKSISTYLSDNEVSVRIGELEELPLLEHLHLSWSQK